MEDYTNFIRYLAAKKSVDDRALNRAVWDQLASVLKDARQPVKILEIGGACQRGDLAHCRADRQSPDFRRAIYQKDGGRIPGRGACRTGRSLAASSRRLLRAMDGRHMEHAKAGPDLRTVCRLLILFCRSWHQGTLIFANQH